MRRFLQRYKFRIILVLLAFSISPFIVEIAERDANHSLRNERYNPSLSRLNSIKKLSEYTDSIYNQKGLDHLDTAVYTDIVSQAVKDRFAFGLANYRFSENWIAYFLGKMAWSHFSAIVNPEDILKRSNGLCSQQTIVFMEVLRKKGIIQRSVGLGSPTGPGHFLCEVHYEKGWHVFDVTMEPLWEKTAIHHESMEYYTRNKDSLYLAYEERYQKPMFIKMMDIIEYGKPNRFPASRMLIFHHVTNAFTFIIPVILLFMLISSYRNRKT